jgi:hypothetical protein
VTVSDAIIAKSVGAWHDQAREAWEALASQLPEGASPPIGELAEVDPAAFGSLIEALVALEPYTGRRVGQDLIQLAGLRPVSEVLGLPS